MDFGSCQNDLECQLSGGGGVIGDAGGVQVSKVRREGDREGLWKALGVFRGSGFKTVLEDWREN